MTTRAFLQHGCKCAVEACATLAGGLSLTMLGLAVLTPGRLWGIRLQSPSAALLTLAFCLALVALARRPYARVFGLGQALAALVGVESLLALAGHGWGWANQMAHGGAGRFLIAKLPILTCWSFLALALAYLVRTSLSEAGPKRRQLSALLALIPVGICVVVLMCHPEGAPLLDGGRRAPMSLPTAVGGILMGIALLALAGSDRWPMALFRSEHVQGESRGARWLRRGPFGLFVILSLCILVLGSLYLRAQTRAALLSTQRELSAAADFKAQGLEAWFAERTGDADEIFGSALLQRELSRFLVHEGGDGKELVQWMAGLRKANGFQRVALYDGKAQLKLGLPGAGEGGASPVDPAEVRSALELRHVAFVDLHVNRFSGRYELGFWIPVRSAPGQGGAALGVLLLALDADRLLFPLLNFSFFTGTSTETVLVRREGQQSVLLSPLRPPGPGTLSGGRSHDVRPGVLSNLDAPGIRVGRDPHGKLVLAFARRVNGTPWEMVTMANEWEIFAPLRRGAWLTASGLLGLVVLLAMGMGLAVRQGDARRILSQLAFERERKVLAERFSKAFSTTPDAMAITRMTDGVYLDVNPGFCKLSGYSSEELLGHSSLSEELDIWVRREDRERLLSLLREKGEVLDLESEFRSKQGATIIGAMSATILEFNDVACVLSVTRDMTHYRKAEMERRLLEAQLHQVQKQESLGALAGGVAHDINNVLGAILGLASAHRATLGEEDPLARSFDTIVKACLRGRDVVKSLLCFARKDLAESKPLDLNGLIQEVIQLLAHTTLQRIQLETQLQEDLWSIEGDAGALSHALMNLCVNALDAMPGGGHLRLKTENLPGRRVGLTVTDSGEGMSPEVQEKAVEPFFTTKPMGKGTGLGLAMVFGTVKAHGGTFEIRSARGQGTSILLGFPASALAPSRGEAPLSPSVQGGGLDILLVDDDDLIRDSVPPILRRLGHRVRTAASGEEGLNLLEGSLRVDLVILDMNMPGMNGAETLGRIQAWNPKLPVLLASGYSDGDISALLAGHPNVDYIQKPFSLSELQVKLGASRLWGPGSDPEGSDRHFT